MYTPCTFSFFVIYFFLLDLAFTLSKFGIYAVISSPICTSRSSIACSVSLTPHSCCFSIISLFTQTHPTHGILNYILPHVGWFRCTHILLFHSNIKKRDLVIVAYIRFAPIVFPENFSYCTYERLYTDSFHFTNHFVKIKFFF